MRKIIIGILFFIIIAYFGIGFYVYGESVAVPCAVVESEKENRPDNFSLGEKADWDPSEYFVQDYETVLINTNDDVVLSGWWMETDKNAPTIIGLHGVTSGKHSPDVLLVGGMLVNEGFNYLTFDFRDHGESTCEDGVHSAGQKEIYDVKAAIDWLINEKDIPSENIGLHGSSFGAMVALMTQYISDDINALSIVDTPFDFATDKIPYYDDLQKFENDMVRTMHTANGMGLAANQIGITKRFFAIGHESFDTFKKSAIIWNPLIKKQSEEKIFDVEGCLSFPGIFVK